MKEQWEKFFLYLDVESMILRDSRRRRQWQAESEEGRIRMVSEYKMNLQKTTVDGDFSTIPIQYSIVNTRYGQIEGEVKAIASYRDGQYISRKELTYLLNKKDNIWLVTGYSVINLGAQ
jgi:hypothetical protein